MKFVILALLVGLAAASDVQSLLDNGAHPFSAEVVNAINNAGTTWKAKQHFSEKDLENVKVKLGAILNSPLSHAEPLNDPSHFDLNADIPKEFDARKQWPKCAKIIGDIRDQANCGSCWAFGAVGVMSDRLCIASNGEQQVQISADDLLTCCTLLDNFSFCGFGCNGGMPNLAFRYWVKKGIVSGGKFNETNTCRPYEIEPCGHHTKDHPKPCKGMSATPKCVKKCVNGADYKQDKHYGTKSYGLKGEEQIQREILQYGPVAAAFTVYSDFPQYKEGVYQRTTSDALGGHAVRIIGWGEEKGTPYWIVANSWNVDWGQNGYFRILRGADHCGIESQIVSGLAKV